MCFATKGYDKNANSRCFRELIYHTTNTQRHTQLPTTSHPTPLKPVNPIVWMPWANKLTDITHNVGVCVGVSASNRMITEKCKDIFDSPVKTAGDQRTSAE